MTEKEAQKIRSAYANGYEFPFGNGFEEKCDMNEVNRHHRHGKAFYKPYRNYFCAGSSGDRLLDKLTGVLGLAEKKQSERCTYYYLTRAGLDWLGRRLKMEIGDERN